MAFVLLLPTLTSLLAAAISLHLLWRKKSQDLEAKVRELENSLNSSLRNCAAERQGRIRAQQALRKELAEPKSENVDHTSYPLTPIGFVHSCFSIRSGTPRQPLLVPLAKATLVFNPARVPLASLEGLEEYSHCWILYVFHLNTDLDKLWNPPSKSKFKAKVRVPRLKGERMGVFATRSPHRPCPIGLTVAKVESVQGNKLLLTGVDLVDGTPVLDIKPYLPYSDSIQEATVPKWVMVDDVLAVASVSFSVGFSSALNRCWETRKKKTLYESAEELQNLIKQVLSFDIRSISQQTRPHGSLITKGNLIEEQNGLDLDEYRHDVVSSGHDEYCHDERTCSLPCNEIIYHLILDGLDISYKIESYGRVMVEGVSISNGN